MFPKGGPGRSCPRVQEPGQARAEEVELSRTSQMEGHSWDLCAGHRSAQRGRKWIKVRSPEAGRTLAQ